MNFNYNHVILKCFHGNYGLATDSRFHNKTIYCGKHVAALEIGTMFFLQVGDTKSVASVQIDALFFLQFGEAVANASSFSSKIISHTRQISYSQKVPKAMMSRNYLFY